MSQEIRLKNINQTRNYFPEKNREKWIYKEKAQKG